MSSLLKELCTDTTKLIGEKTLMNKKDLTSQVVNSVNLITTQDLPTELAELSEENLQLVVGGTGGCCCGSGSGGTGSGSGGTGSGSGGTGGGGREVHIDKDGNIVVKYPKSSAISAFKNNSLYDITL
jgi:hypothetical protein